MLKSYATINSSGAHPPPHPTETAGHLFTLSVLGVGHSQFYCGPGSWALGYPGHLKRVSKLRRLGIKTYETNKYDTRVKNLPTACYM